MATNRGKVRGQKTSAYSTRRSVNPRTTTEEVTTHGDIESTSKHNFAALQKAFKDVSRKLCKAQDENMKLQTDNTALLQENEILKQKLGQGFKAFDDKFKETEQLKKELDLKEKQIADKISESNSDQECQTESTGSISCPEAIDTIQQETNSTQTEEEKTDEVAISPQNYKELLEYCGFEIVFQNDKEYLIITNRDKFICWFENETDGKVSVEFEKAPVVERFTQTDKDITDIQHVQPCNHEGMIILFKSKIADQADTINRYRQVLTQMKHDQSSAPILLQRENNGTNKTGNQALTRYHQTFLRHSEEVAKQVHVLRKELESQQHYTRHLVNIIKGSKDVPKQIKWLSEVTHENLKSHSQREIKMPPTFRIPVLEQHFEGDTEETSNEKDVDNSNGLCSIAVQATDDYPATDEGSESSASVLTLAESRSSSSNKSGLGFSQARGLVDTSKKTAFGDREETKSATVVPSNDNEQIHDNDDIEVINEDDVAMGGGGATGIVVGNKQCPVCYITFTPSSSQDEFEKHVLAHFQD